MDVEKSQTYRLSVFRDCETLFQKKFPQTFFDILQQWMLENSKGSPF